MIPSAAASAAAPPPSWPGVVLGAAVGRRSVDADELLALAAALEGHPDNVAAAFYGGFTVALADDGRITLRRFRAPEAWIPVAFIPQYESRTVDMRAALPASRGPRGGRPPGRAQRAAGDSDHDLRRRAARAAMADELHQPFRLPLLPGSRELIELAYERGAAGARLSGAGPAVLAICDSPPNAHARREGVERLRRRGHGHATALRHVRGQARRRLGAPPAATMRTPMSLVTISGVSKSHAAQHLFADVGLMISAGRRIAVVGPNGAGKTTLLELITGDQEPDAGTITRAREVVIGYLRQEVAESRAAACWPRCSPALAR